MKYDLTKWNGNYEVKVVVDAAMQDEMRQGALKIAQKDFSFHGFRQGHVPLSIVEKNIKPEYMQMAMYEEVLNKTLQQVVKENEKIKFIGQPYDLQDNKDDKWRVITFKIDVYPEVEVKDSKWKSAHVHTIETKPTAEEEANALMNLRRQYADYKDVDAITEDSVTKLKFIITDKSWEEIDKGSAFLGKEEYEEFENIKKAFVWQSKDTTVELAYDEKKLPHVLHIHKKEGEDKTEKPHSIKATIVDIKQVILPDFNDAELLQKLFQNEEISSEAVLKNKIHEVLTEQKRENALHHAIEHVIDQVSASMSISIPHTILREEMAARVKQLGDRMGGEAGMKQYFDQIGEEGTKKVYDDIENSAKQSLEKFFILRKLVELLEIDDINREKHLDAEEKIYEKLSAGGAKVHADHKNHDHANETDKSSSEKPKKATAKAKKETDSDEAAVKKPRKAAVKKKKEE
jgi:trigger factor